MLVVHCICTFLGLSTRNVAKAMFCFRKVKRSHVAIWKWIKTILLIRFFKEEKGINILGKWCSPKNRLREGLSIWAGLLEFIIPRELCFKCHRKNAIFRFVSFHVP